jgi:2-C-methyl-D-erythritol 4-phosphate cytidylyltransferase
MNWLIMVAGGNGKRANLGFNKVFAKLGKLTILEQSLLAFEKNKTIDKIIISIGNKDMKKAKIIVKKTGSKKVADFVGAGDSRQESTLKILKKYEHEIKKDDLVGVHNAVNPFVSQSEIDEVYKNAKRFGAALLAQKARDTVKISDEDGLVEMTPLRDFSWYAQTPQVATFGNLLKAHMNARRDNFIGTDDAQLLEQIGIRPKIVESSNKNFKITFKEDLESAKNILKTWEE